ncbi:hypothetical protein DNTS_015402 [Danionella cerebrum]|uniref:Fibrinogen C-terminal domain-containing protein n=1 Tax=Danionella cerebrum TaxID=2873325 RepID=A0A553R3T2_9TELE|nr:hypothetical protein DNTS_015402 [Danionella translucida]
MVLPESEPFPALIGQNQQGITRSRRVSSPSCGRRSDAQNLLSSARSVSSSPKFNRVPGFLTETGSRSRLSLSPRLSSHVFVKTTAESAGGQLLLLSLTTHGGFMLIKSYDICKSFVKHIWQLTLLEVGIPVSLELNTSSFFTRSSLVSSRAVPRELHQEQRTLHKPTKAGSEREAEAFVPDSIVSIRFFFQDLCYVTTLLQSSADGELLVESGREGGREEGKDQEQKDSFSGGEKSSGTPENPVPLSAVSKAPLPKRGALRRVTGGSRQEAEERPGESRRLMLSCREAHSSILLQTSTLLKMSSASLTLLLLVLGHVAAQSALKKNPATTKAAKAAQCCDEVRSLKVQLANLSSVLEELNKRQESELLKVVRQMMELEKLNQQQEARVTEAESKYSEIYNQIEIMQLQAAQSAPQQSTSVGTTLGTFPFENSNIAGAEREKFASEHNRFLSEESRSVNRQRISEFGGVCLRVFSSTLPELHYTAPVIIGVGCRAAAGSESCRFTIIIGSRKKGARMFSPSDAIYDCASLYSKNYKISGEYKLPKDDFLGTPELSVFCDMENSGGGWTVIQRRKIGLTSFNRDWKQYKSGFGTIRGDFWLGNEHIFRLTRQPTDWEGETRYAEYGFFTLKNEMNSYKLFLANYSGNAGDSLRYHNNTNFSTKDKDNDKCLDNCAQLRQGGYWYNCCTDSNLNGVFYRYGAHTRNPDGISWYGWHGPNYSLKRVEMKIRPQSFVP